MNRTMFRPVALAVMLALSAPSLATDPFQPLPDLETLPDLDSAPPRKLHADQPSWGQPVDANGNVSASNGSRNENNRDNTNGTASSNDNGGYASNNTGGNNNGTASSNDNGGYASNKTGGNNNGTSGGGNNNANGNGGHNSDAYPPLTKVDAAMQPNYTPPGMPQMPSKCAENASCRPCFDTANANLDTRRRNLEKVRGIYTYTHRFAQDGKDLMNGVAGLAGGAPAVEAAVQSRSVDQSLDAFDDTVRAKNAELLGKLQDDLHELAACEAKYYGNDEWYARYGELYYQFMQARYSL